MHCAWVMHTLGTHLVKILTFTHPKKMSKGYMVWACGEEERTLLGSKITRCHAEVNNANLGDDKSDKKKIY